VPPPDSLIYPYSFASPQDSEFLFYADSGLEYTAGKLGNNLQQQFNVTDNVSRIVGAHQLKFGLDYRRVNPDAGITPYTVQYLFDSLSNVVANTLPEAFIASRATDVQLTFSNWSLFAQDTWKATRTLQNTHTKTSMTTSLKDSRAEF
jgi:hypothetical protein